MTTTDVGDIRILRRQRLKRLFTVGAVPLLGLLIARGFWKSPLAELNSIVSRFFPKPDPYSLDGRTAVGYWDDSRGRSASVLDAVDTNWDLDEKQMVMNYLERAFSSSADDDSENDLPTVIKVWRGLATCRLCDEILGNTCHGDAKFNWPEGYLHYIRKHNVKPPKYFINHIRKQAITTKA